MTDMLFWTSDTHTHAFLFKIDCFNSVMNEKTKNNGRIIEIELACCHTHCKPTFENDISPNLKFAQTIPVYNNQYGCILEIFPILR